MGKCIKIYYCKYDLLFSHRRNLLIFFRVRKTIIFFSWQNLYTQVVVILFVTYNNTYCTAKLISLDFLLWLRGELWTFYLLILVLQDMLIALKMQAWNVQW